MPKIQKQFLNNKTSHLTSTVRFILSDNSPFETIESYNQIRTNIMFSLPKSDVAKRIVILSSEPGDGKTTTTTNLAITFAQMGVKVLVIDCDLRKPRIHRYLELDRNPGISNVLCGFAELDKVINKNVRENLDIITAGEIPPNPSEIIVSEEFSSVLKTLETRYDYIFIDSPPVSVVTDGVLISKNCTGSVVVVRQGVTTTDTLDFTIDSLKKTSSKILGFVFITTEKSRKKYGYYRNYSYKYKYRYRYIDEDAL